MRKRCSFLLTIIVDPEANTEWTGRIKTIRTGRTVSFHGIEELRAQLHAELMDSEIIVHTGSLFSPPTTGSDSSKLID